MATPSGAWNSAPVRSKPNGLTRTSPTPAGASMPAASSSRENAHDTSLPSSVAGGGKAMRTAKGSSRSYRSVAATDSVWGAAATSRACTACSMTVDKACSFVRGSLTPPLHRERRRIDSNPCIG